MFVDKVVKRKELCFKYIYLRFWFSASLNGLQASYERFVMLKCDFLLKIDHFRLFCCQYGFQNVNFFSLYKCLMILQLLRPKSGQLDKYF